MNKIYETNVRIYTLQDIPQENIITHLSRLIDQTFDGKENLVDQHYSNKYKLYAFNRPYPVQRGMYPAGNIYDFQIRTSSETMAKHFATTMRQSETDSIKAIVSGSREIGLGHLPISKIYSITPVVIKTPEGYWRSAMSLEQYIDQLQINIVRKYNAFNEEQLPLNTKFIKKFSFRNKGPIHCRYKNVRLLGDTLEIMVEENEMAQRLVKTAVATGLGGMNARGYGYVNYQYGSDGDKS